MSRAAELGLIVMTTTFASVDDYIASFSPEVGTILTAIRRTIHTALPESGEAISYGIPTVTLGGRAVVYFAGWKRHVSVYPLPPGDDVFDQAVAPYRSGAGTAKFPLDEPIPFELITTITELLAQQHGAAPTS